MERLFESPSSTEWSGSPLVFGKHLFISLWHHEVFLMVILSKHCKPAFRLSLQSAKKNPLQILIAPAQL